MAVRLYPKEYVEYELGLRNCIKMKDYKTCSLWRTPDGFFFTVPREADGSCDENSLRAVLTELQNRQGWK